MSASFPKPKVLCLGEALVDRLGPLGGDPAVDQPIDDRLGGAPANVVCGLARLGTPAAFLGRLGDDEIGARFRELLLARNVNLDALQIDQLRPSRIVLVRRDLEGERVFQGFAGDQGEGFADQALDQSALANAWSSLIETAQWLLIGSIPLASDISASALLWSVQNAIESGCSLALDVNWRPTFWDSSSSPDSGPDTRAIEAIAPLFEHASLLKLAKEEALWFFGSDDPEVISRSLVKRPDVVVTDGANPVHWLMHGCKGMMSAFLPPTVVDTTGAGDAFTAGMLNQLLAAPLAIGDENRVEQIMGFAAACGALVCTGAGGIDPQPSTEEVTTFLSSSAHASR